MEHAKSRNLEYRRLLQQWEQLSVMDEVLLQLYTQPRENQGWTQLVVPEKFCRDILKEIHEGVIGGHLGQEKTVSKLKERFYWPGHHNDVRNWCQSCRACAKKAASTEQGGSHANNNCRLPHTDYVSGSVRTTSRKHEGKPSCDGGGRLFFPLDESSAHTQLGSINSCREVS